MHPSSSARHLTTVSVLAAAGIALFVLESFIPMPLPFLKVGLANVSTLVTLAGFSFADALLVVALRVVVGSLLVGTFMGPAFVIALSAGMCSAAAMALSWRFTGKMFSPVGISLIGSTTHVVTQLVVVRGLYVHSIALSYLLPFLLLSALLGGLVVGLISSRLITALRTTGTFSQSGHNTPR